MSTLDDKSEEAVQQVETTKCPEKERKNGGWGVVLIFFIIGLIASLAVGWIIFPKLLYSKKKQPVDFNHVFHVAAVENGCESCHYFREDGSFSGVPKLAQCVECHEEVQGENPEEFKFVKEYVTKGNEVPWLVYSRQPDCVFFSHAAHVKMGELDCVTCHGHIGESKHSRVYEENRLTGYSRDIWGKNIAGLKKNTWDRMKMDDCAECHATFKAEVKTVQTLPWPISWMPRPYEKPASSQVRVQIQKDACFVCHK
ncbi:MAG TPA: menaquinone reductase multiheme cytochrome c subunit QrcA [Anaerolineae bacterium]|nr:menaquinone reductase multiheme cytochrome c subunit QrcA [Anaerolineae bacterium]